MKFEYFYLPKNFIMKKLVLLPLIFILFSCQEDEQIFEVEKPVTPIIPEPNPTPNENSVYVFDNAYDFAELKYYKGADGKEYSNEAQSFFKSQWSTYTDPSIKNITLKKDSIIITQEQVTTKYKFRIENENIITDDERKQVLGKKVNEKELTFYKNFVTYNVVNTETQETFYGKNINLGAVSAKDIFPRIVAAPTNLKANNEFVFYGNLSYKFKLQ